MITEAQLKLIYPQARGRTPLFIEPLNAAMEYAEVNTPIRMAMFLAQVGHESAQLLYMRELASGAAYEGRLDLGNTSLGDGVRYKGRGPIQITGKANYIAVSFALDIDCIEHPELLEQPHDGCMAAGWFWATHKLNALADKKNFVGVTQKINGGTNGLPSRVYLYEAAKKVLGI